MDIKQNIEDEFEVSELYVRTIFVYFSMFDIPLKFLLPYMKYITRNPSTKVNLIPEGDVNKYVQFKNGCVGGTFDHLHLGHQILLIRSALLSKNSLFIGVTSDEMLSKKKNKEIIQPCFLRIKKVKQFMSIILKMKPDLQLTVNRIDDPYGPPIHQAYFDGIIVSEETIKGGEKINEIRKQKQMPSLQIHICPAISPQNTIQAKISSSGVREYLLAKNNMSIEQFLLYRQKWNKVIAKLFPYFEIEETEKLKQIRDEWWFKIMQLYSEHWRYYHTNRHILSMLCELEQSEWTYTLEQQIILVISIYFHDIHYVPSDKDNEEKSALLAEQFLKELVQPSHKRDDLIDSIKKAIICTKNHEPSNLAERMLVDLDMSILDSDPAQYETYSQQIEKEYSPLVGNAYKEKRIAFLKTVNADAIFTLKKGTNIHKNIDWQIEKLKMNNDL